MKILYVEDDPRDADLAVRMLRRTAPHLQLETVSSIQAALDRLEHLAEDPVDLVLVDMHLRDGDGLSLLRHIRENTLPLAVVLITGAGDEETAVAALKARADDYVIKRKDYLDRLPITLESALNHYRADAARQSYPLNVLYAEPDVYDVELTRRHLTVHAHHINLDVVSSGLEVLSGFQSNERTTHYDVLLMNLKLPGLNALDVLRELRLAHKQDVPVVLLCRDGDEELARQGIKLGASRYLVKNHGYLYQLPWEIEEAHSHADLKRREAALHASEARNRAILQAIPDLMLLFNREGTFLDHHTKNTNLLPLPAEELIGKILGEVFPAQLAADLASCFTRALSSDKPVLLEYTLTVPQGVRRFEASIVACDGDKILAMVRDITERKEVEESLRSALAEVEELKDRLHEENIYLQEEIRVASNFGEIIGNSEPLRKVLLEAEQVAPVDSTVLILGETGTGKELFAHAIHKLSPRRNHALVKVNCAALPAPLIESELFGHAKGAFTGASTQRTGRFEIANGGSILLDEVGELPLDLQAKLLRVLEEGEFEPVGSNKSIKVDVRIIAATNRDLTEAVREGTFRSDLYYRLSIFPITLPPLRERREDIPMLVMHLVKQLNIKLAKHIDTIPNEIMTVLKRYSWPGNIRELRNVIERAVIITQGSKLRLIDRLDTESLEEEPGVYDVQADSPFSPVRDHETLEQCEYNLILSTLKEVHWRVEGLGGAAELLKVHPSTLRTRMKKLGIKKPNIHTSSMSG